VHVGGPVTADASASYTAEILPATNDAPQEYILIDPDGMLGVDRPVSNLAAKVATLLVPKVELTWEAKGDNLPLDDSHQTNGTGQVMGKRIFVGAKTPSESDARNTVMLKVKVTPALPGSNVWVRSFDVDDTTPDRDDNEGIIDANGRAGEDNFTDLFNTPITGLFVTNGQSSYTATLDANGEALVEFKVGAQPGNNYRVAGTVFPTGTLSSLQSGNAAGSNYVSAYTDTIRGGFNGSLSPLLTVWRKLHIEFDSMGAPAANEVSGRIFSVVKGSPAANQSTIWFWSQTQHQASQFEKGRIEISGSGNYPVASSGFVRNGGIFGKLEYVILGAVPATSEVLLKNAPFTLTDDDDQLLAQAGLPPSLPKTVSVPTVLNTVQSLFEPAGIFLEDAGAAGLNLRPSLPFSLNEPAFFPNNPYGSSMFNNAADINDSSIFWAHLVSFGYQPATSEDGDPDGESPLYGGTPEPLGISRGYSVVFVESVREKWSISAPTNQLYDYYWVFLCGTVAHELAHSPGSQGEGADHEEHGLLDEGEINMKENNFAPKTVKRMRTASSWSQ
jgi:hypothetical protein